ncbi:MAG: amidohydrolase family protein [Alsobacter sp.]
MAIEITGSYRFLKPRPEWLRLRQEDILEPERAIFDAHHHIWEQDGNPYLLDELVADLDTGHNVVGTVFIEAHYGHHTDGPLALRPVGETERIDRLAQEAGRRGRPGICAGIVGFADLMLGEDVVPVLEAHIAASPTRLKGIRHFVSHDPAFPDGIIVKPANPGLLGTTAYRDGLRAVGRQGLSYDAMLYHRQIPELTAVARLMPDLPIVLDHYGSILGVGPFSAQPRETFEAWRQNLTALAACPNVSVKLGGMGMVICGGRWHENELPPGSDELAQAWRPYFETAIDLFGVERCMFESNFPVDKGMVSYPVLWNTYKRLASGFTQSEKSALFHDNACRFYRIAV